MHVLVDMICVCQSYTECAFYATDVHTTHSYWQEVPAYTPNLQSLVMPLGLPTKVPTLLASSTSTQPLFFSTTPESKAFPTTAYI